ncbi:MAG TPA: FAD-dependent 5-carboxymethylaminomethyl-2-thiouridine(34) oxidoreductase MnmC, partial [Methylophilus sp.]|nr:FAD-dependent 5-carboxymethylaminomethyl-2-thiouridine(34) oxidoreductase MnmC [Methylophilus sp.]
IAGIPVKHLGLFIPEAGWVDPHVWCTRLTSLNNIERTLDTTALRIEHTDHGWRVHSAKQTFEAEHVVLCNAYDACELIPQLRSFLTPVRGQINFAAPSELSQNIRSVICAQHFISPAVNGLHTLGTTYANHDMTPECTDCDTKTNLQSLSQINTDLPKTLDPSLHPGRVGWRCATMDYLPMVGQMLDLEALHNKPPRPNASSRTLPWLQGLYVNIGHGSKGMITAPLSGDWLAGIITGQIPHNPLLARIQPNRFKMRELGLKQLAQHIYG